MTRIRVIDLETTGIGPEHEIVEIAAVDIVGNDLIIVGSDLVRPSVPIAARGVKPRMEPSAFWLRYSSDGKVWVCLVAADEGAPGGLFGGYRPTLR